MRGCNADATGCFELNNLYRAEYQALLGPSAAVRPEFIDFDKADVHSGCGRALARVRFDVGRSRSRPPDESTSGSEQRQR